MRDFTCLKFTFFRQRLIPRRPGVFVIVANGEWVAVGQAADLRSAYADQFTSPTTPQLAAAIDGETALAFTYVEVERADDRVRLLGSLLQRAGLS